MDSLPPSQNLFCRYRYCINVLFWFCDEINVLSLYNNSNVRSHCGPGNADVVFYFYLSGVDTCQLLIFCYLRLNLKIRHGTKIRNVVTNH